jgi:hypothetical protein
VTKWFRKHWPLIAAAAVIAYLLATREVAAQGCVPIRCSSKGWSKVCWQYDAKTGKRLYNQFSIARGDTICAGPTTTVDIKDRRGRVVESRQLVYRDLTVRPYSGRYYLLSDFTYAGKE